jgi:hypothetical protein
MPGDRQGSIITPAAAAVTLSDAFVAAVRTRLDARQLLALSVLKKVTRCPDPAWAGAALAREVEAAIRATPAGAGLAPRMVEQIRGCVVAAVLEQGRRGRADASARPSPSG